MREHNGGRRQPTTTPGDKIDSMRQSWHGHIEASRCTHHPTRKRNNQARRLMFLWGRALRRVAAVWLRSRSAFRHRWNQCTSTHVFQRNGYLVPVNAAYGMWAQKGITTAALHAHANQAHMGGTVRCST